MRSLDIAVTNLGADIAVILKSSPYGNRLQAKKEEGREGRRGEGGRRKERIELNWVELSKDNQTETWL
jgi:hypothetical protein